MGVVSAVDTAVLTMTHACMIRALGSALTPVPDTHYRYQNYSDETYGIGAPTVYKGAQPRLNPSNRTSRAQLTTDVD